MQGTHSQKIVNYRMNRILLCQILQILLNFKIDLKYVSVTENRYSRYSSLQILIKIRLETNKQISCLSENTYVKM